MHDRLKDTSSAPAARDVAAFVADLSAELSGMARQQRFETLAYLLEMASLEADAIRRRMGGDDA
jgi:hypothetical protein